MPGQRLGSAPVVATIAQRNRRHHGPCNPRPLRPGYPPCGTPNVRPHEPAHRSTGAACSTIRPSASGRLCAGPAHGRAAVCRSVHQPRPACGPPGTSEHPPAPSRGAGAPCHLVLGKACRLRLERCGPLVALGIASRQHKQTLVPSELNWSCSEPRGSRTRTLLPRLPSRPPRSAPTCTPPAHRLRSAARVW